MRFVKFRSREPREKSVQSDEKLRANFGKLEDTPIRTNKQTTVKSDFEAE